MDKKGRNGGTLRSYEKGQSGNPAGRPKKKPDLISQIIREMGQDWTELEITLTGRHEGKRPVIYQQRYLTDGQSTFNLLIAYRLLVMALAGDSEAIRIILDRTEGSIPPPLHLAGSGSVNPLTVVLIPPEELATAFSEERSDQN